MKRILTLVAVSLLAGTGSQTAIASDIRVQPVTVEPLAGARSASLTLINDEQKPVRVQVRIFRWSQNDGQERLTPTQDVVASPPFATLAPGQHSLVRLVRTSKAAIKNEEAYRILVDEVPEPGDVRPSTVNLVLRQSIPVFFSETAQRASVVDWSIDHDGSQTWLTAQNRGGRRLRLSDVMIQDHDEVVHHQPGLVGYVLAGETMRWPIEAENHHRVDPSLHLRAVSDTGIVEVPLVDAPGS